MSFDLGMEPAIDIVDYTPCLIDDLDTSFGDDTLFGDQLNQVIKPKSLSESSDSGMSTIGCDADQLFPEIASESSFSPNHSLISEEDDVDLLSFLVRDNDIKTVSTTNEVAGSRNRKSKTDNTSASIADRNRKNAIAAKENREKKKKYIEGLEAENATLSAENQELKLQTRDMKRKVNRLEEEVLYLKGVLANQSTLSNLLKNIGKCDVKLTTSFDNVTKETGEPKSKRPRTVKSSGGVCLHVADDNVSLEFCSKCAAMAAGQGRD